MNATKAIPRVMGALAMLLLGPLCGILIAFLLAGLALPPDPNFVSDGGHAAPGDGLLILDFVFVSLVASVPLSVLGAGLVLFRGPNTIDLPRNED